jgi:neutral ceramidase
MMKKAILLSVVSMFLIFISVNAADVDQQAKIKGWKAGVARVKITPEEPTWMAGYGSRDHPSEGTLVDLWAKALAIEDANGKKVVLVTTDLLGFPQKVSNRIRDRIGAKFGLTRAQIILSSSHTHSGPVVGEALADVYPMDAKQKEVVKNYTVNLENKIVSLVGEAIRSMTPAQLYSQNGVTRFQVNRRNNKEANIGQITDLNGPNDYAVPVLKVANEAGDLMAVAFGYACHATVLGLYQFSGDYPGYAQIEVEKLHPGVTAMFFQGAGADQNPLPRRTIPLAQQYGRELAAAVDRVINEDMKKLEPTISTAYSEVQLKFSTPPTREELIKIEKESGNSDKRWAQNQLENLRKNGSLLTSYPYPVQIWKLGDQPIMTLGGELVVQYAIELKKMFGQNIFVMGYANDEMAYIPSEVVLQEGGYEGDTSQKVYGMPGKWATGIQNNILNAFEALAVKANVQKVTK